MPPAGGCRALSDGELPADPAGQQDGGGSLPLPWQRVQLPCNQKRKELRELLTPGNSFSRVSAMGMIKESLILEKTNDIILSNHPTTSNIAH